MEKEINKISYKVLTLVLCLCIVFGAFAPAYADDSTSGYSYYRAGSTLNPYTQQSGKNSADMIGRLLDVSSYNQAMIYNRLLQMSSSGADLTTVNSYISSIDDKLGVIRDSLGIGNSLNNILVNQDSNLVHLNTIINKLSYWDNNHARSYDLSEMIFNIMGYNNSIEDLLSGGAITSDWHWNDNGTWRAVGANTIPVINRNSDGQLYLNVYPYEASNLSIKGLLQAIIRNQFYETTSIRGTYENNMFSEYTSSGAINPQPVDNIIKGLSWINNNTALGLADIVSYFKPYTSKVFRYIQQTGIDATATIQNTSTNTPYIQYNTNLQRLIETANPVNIYEFLDIINKNMTMGVNSIFTPRGDYRDYTYNSSSNSVIASSNIDGPFSVMDYLARIQQRTELYLGKIQFVLADDNTIAAKKANQNQEDTVLTNFTGSGTASASVSDFGAVKDSMVDLKAGFTGGASSSDTFSFLSGDSNAWDWFTQDTANDLDRTQGSNTRLLRSSSSVASDTPLLDSYYNYIMSILGGD